MAIAAHGLGGGGYPGSAALTLLLAVCAGVGAVVAQLPSRTHGRLPLIAALAAGQLVGHLALATTVGDTHHHAMLPGPLMLAHAAATVVCALLIAVAERLYGTVTRVLRRVLRAVTPPVDRPAPRPMPSHRADLSSALLRSGISRRGPPAAA